MPAEVVCNKPARKWLRFLMLIVPVVIVSTACNDSFITEDNINTNEPVSESGIIISPEWETADYQFYCTVNKTVGFTIVEVPEWLVVESTSDILIANPSDIQSTGIIRAKAIIHTGFEKTGMYLDFMKIKVSDQIYQIPVFYLSQGNPDFSTDETLNIHYNNERPIQLKVRNESEGILIWNIISMPPWLQLSESHDPSSTILPRNSHYTIPFEFNPEKLPESENVLGQIVFKTNVGRKSVLSVPVSMEIGQPKAGFNSNGMQSLEFTSERSVVGAYVSNYAPGLLLWKIKGLPAWLSVDKNSGVLFSNQNLLLRFDCNIDQLPAGWTRDTIQLVTNDPNRKEIEVVISARGNGNPDTVIPVEGQVVDATYNHQQDLLIYITKEPNQLIVFDIKSKTVKHKLFLLKEPSCLALSEDQKQAVIGYSGRISVINTSDFRISKELEISNIVFDIAWVESTLYCYTEKAYNSDYLFWIDVSTDENSKTLDYGLDGRTILKKVPDKPYLILTRQSTSPNGWFVFNTSNRKLQSYSHKTGGDFWFVNNGQQFISRTGFVYSTASAINSYDTFNFQPEVIAQLYDESGKNLLYPWWADNAPAGNSVFLINYHYSNQKYIYQLSSSNFSVIKTIAYDKFYHIANRNELWPVQAHYVFATNEGTELVVVKKPTQYDTNWSLELLKVYY
jgi:hypothetical protein